MSVTNTDYIAPKRAPDVIINGLHAIGDCTIDSLDITNGTIVNIDVTNITATNIDTTNLTATDADLTNITSTNIVVTNITATNISGFYTATLHESALIVGLTETAGTFDFGLTKAGGGVCFNFPDMTVTMASTIAISMLTHLPTDFIPASSVYFNYYYTANSVDGYGFCHITPVTGEVTWAQGVQGQPFTSGEVIVIHGGGCGWTTFAV